MKIGVIGLGLIGGSIAKEIKLRSLSTIEVFGSDKKKEHEHEAIELGLIDTVVTVDEMLSICDTLVLGIPVSAIASELSGILDKTKNNQVIIDTGSTKKDICTSVSNHPNRGRFVAAHPLAGTEFSGPSAALIDLFKGKKNIICEKDKSDEDALKTALNLFQFLGMQSVYLNPEEHDRHMAYVSHLSHVSSFTLSLAVLEIEKDEKQIFNLASTGFESTARLAKSNAKTWGPIFDANAEYLLEAIDFYMDKMSEFRNLIATNQVHEMESLMTKANDIKRVLKGITLNN